MSSDKNDEKPINILLVIQNQLLQEVQPLIAQVADFNIVGHTTSGQQAYQLAKELKVDIAIIGNNLDDMTGAKACYNLTEDLPVGVLMVGFSEHHTIFQLHDAVRAHAYYYYPSIVSASEFQAKIREGYQMYEYNRNKFASKQE